MLKSGDGNTDSLYISCDSSSDFIIVVLPYRVYFRWPHIFYYIDDFLHHWCNIHVYHFFQFWGNQYT